MGLYLFLRTYVRIILFFYFKKIIVVGEEHIPKNEAVLFVGNHENALLDSIMLAVTNNKKAYFLTRASVFKNPFVKRFLNTIRMIPVYRVRDGWQTISKNIEIFETCYNLLNAKKSIAIFPEGNHHLNRRVRNLSKGFTRIIFGALKKYQNLNIYIVPVGINYDTHITYPQSISLYYGKAFLANSYYDTSDLHASTRKLIKKTSDELKNLTVHIDDLSKYDVTISQLKKINANFLNPIETNQLLEEDLKNVPPLQAQKNYPLFFKLIYALTLISAWFPYLIWKLIKPKIKDVIFLGTFRLAVFVILIPLFYVIETLIIYHFWGLTNSLIFMAICLALALLLKLIPYQTK